MTNAGLFRGDDGTVLMLMTPPLPQQRNSSSPAVARMADHTAPVVKLTLTLNSNIAGPARVRRRLSARHGGAERAIIWQKETVPP